jgi:hypothetical protein
LDRFGKSAENGKYFFQKLPGETLERRYPRGGKAYFGGF